MKKIELALSVSVALFAPVLAGTAAAQITIGGVVNAGSRQPSTSPFYGIAQGALFAITGKGLGSDPLQQATTLAYIDVLRVMALVTACMVPLLLLTQKPKGGPPPAGH